MLSIPEEIWDSLIFSLLNQGIINYREMPRIALVESVWRIISLYPVLSVLCLASPFCCSCPSPFGHLFFCHITTKIIPIKKQNFLFLHFCFGNNYVCVTHKIINLYGLCVFLLVLLIQKRIWDSWEKKICNKVNNRKINWCKEKTKPTIEDNDYYHLGTLFFQSNCIA